MKPTAKQRAAIARNKRDGLLCACNKERVPYYGPTPDKHGTKEVGGVLHGYDDCAPADETLRAIDKVLGKRWSKVPRRFPR